MNRQDPIDELQGSPLTLVIGQVRFSPVRKMPDLVDDLQDTMRHSGLERFNVEKVQQVTFGPKITTNDVTRWVFRNRNRTESVFLTQDFVVLATSDYSKFEIFSQRLIEVVEKIRAVADPSYVEQVGIRYLNLLREMDERKPRELLAAGLRGISAEHLQVRKSQNQSMTRCPTGVGMLTIRCLDMAGPDFLPPDLQIEGMKFLNIPDEQEPFCLLDIDNTTSSADAIDFAGLEKVLWSLHRYTSRGFRQSVDDEALDLWRTVE